MKKILVGGLSAVLFLSYGMQDAFSGVSKKEEGPSLKFTGETSVNYYGVNQSFREGNKGKGGGHHLGTEDSRLNVFVLGNTDALGGLEYTALLGLSGNTDDGTPLENRIKLKGYWGTLVLGNTRGVDDVMPWGAFSIMRVATGGFAGSFTNVLNTSTGVITTTDLAGAPKDSTKVTYLTPRVSGFQFGLTFTPSTVQKGDQKLSSYAPSGARSAPFDRNQIGLGLNWRQLFANGFEMMASVTALFGHTKPATRIPASSVIVGLPNDQPLSYRNTESYALGTVLKWNRWSIGDVSFGAEYIDNGKSRVPNYTFSTVGNVTTARPLTGRTAGEAWSVALGLTPRQAPHHKFAIGYYQSSRKMGNNYSGKSKADIYSGTWERKLAPGLGLYAEANYVNMKTPQEVVTEQANLQNSAGALGLNKSDLADPVANNRAAIFIVGTKVKF